MMYACRKNPANCRGHSPAQTIRHQLLVPADIYKEVPPLGQVLRRIRFPGVDRRTTPAQTSPNRWLVRRTVLHGGHNIRGRGNKYQTFEGKMATVAFAHRSVRNAKLNYKNPEFELIAQGYKRSNSSVTRKQPVTASLLLELHRVLQDRRTPENREYNELVWASVVLAFFFLSRSSEMWEPTNRDDLGTAPTRCVRAADVVLRDHRGNVLNNRRGSAVSVEIIYRSHKGDQRRQGTTIRHYRSGQRLLCPVEAAETCLRVHRQWQAAGKRLGPYLSSVSSATTIRKPEVSNLLKEAAKCLQLNPDDNATHSLRIGGACALLAAGKSELVIV